MLQVLQEAHGAGRLDVEELAQRQDMALAAKFVDELSGIVDDLPEGGALVSARPADIVSPAAAPPPATIDGDAGWGIAIMSGRYVRLAPGTNAYKVFAWWGGNEIDVTEVMGPGVVLTLKLPAIMAGNDIFVPPGVRVVDRSIAIMAGNDIHHGAQGDGSNGTLILEGFMFWAGHDVKPAPGS